MSNDQKGRFKQLVEETKEYVEIADAVEARVSEEKETLRQLMEEVERLKENGND